ncbi:MAG TPA: Crp/Fnr family transcriptional regulator [Beijerinckiaceae bacterium]
MAEVMNAVAAFVAKTTWPEAIGYVGVVLSIATSSMRTMIPLRFMGIITNVTFLVYSALCGIYPTLLVNLVLLPLNATRLAQMLRLVRDVKRASATGDLSMEWLTPFMTRRAVRQGEMLFRKGEMAESLYYTLSGRYRLRESGIAIEAGQLVGEMGLLAPGNCRTQGLECVEDGEVLSLTYDELRQLYFQNPEFGFYFLRLTSSRLFENMARLETELEAARASQPARAAA